MSSSVPAAMSRPRAHARRKSAPKHFPTCFSVARIARRSKDGSSSSAASSSSSEDASSSRAEPSGRRAAHSAHCEGATCAAEPPHCEQDQCHWLRFQHTFHRQRERAEPANEQQIQLRQLLEL